MKKYSIKDQYFIDLINKYFRRNDDLLLEQTLSKISQMDNREKNQFIKRCEYPGVLDKLYETGDSEIKNNIKKTPYFQELGQFIDVLSFNKEERIQFARHDSHKNLYILLLFDRDVDVLNNAIYNQSIAIPVLKNLYSKLKDRKLGKIDDVYMRIIEEAIQYKKKVERKTALIEDNSLNLDNPEKLANTIAHLLDEDREVIKFSLYALKKAKYSTFHKVITDYPLFPESGGGENDVTIFRLENRLNSIFSGDFFQDSSTFDVDLSMQVNVFLGEKFDLIKGKVAQSLQQRKLKILENCEKDPSDMNNILCLIYMDLEADPKFIPRVNNIMSIEDIFDLIMDDATPRSFVKEGLQLLDRSPNPEVKERVKEIYLSESQKVWVKLKETEVSVNAYFDLIFQSISLPRIQEQKELKSRLVDARQIMDNLLKEDSTVTSDLLRYLKIAFEKSDNLIKNNLLGFYHIYDHSTEGELVEIQGLLGQIFYLHDIDNNANTGFAIRPGEEDKISKKVLTIWRSAISAYLGRIKELSEILRIKYQALDKSSTAGNFDYRRVLSQTEKLEDSHKKRVKCKLPIQCKNCKKRGCSSERFLRETMLWVDELLSIEQTENGEKTT